MEWHTYKQAFKHVFFVHTIWNILKHCFVLLVASFYKQQFESIFLCKWKLNFLFFYKTSKTQVTKNSIYTKFNLNSHRQMDYVNKLYVLSNYKFTQLNACYDVHRVKKTNKKYTLQICDSLRQFFLIIFIFYSFDSARESLLFQSLIFSFLGKFSVCKSAK